MLFRNIIFKRANVKREVIKIWGNMGEFLYTNYMNL